MKKIVKFCLLIMLVIFTTGILTSGVEARQHKHRAGIEASHVGEAKHYRKHKKVKYTKQRKKKRSGAGAVVAQAIDHVTTATIAATQRFTDLGPRPSRWCGWYMRTLYGGSSAFNRAWAWAKRGVATLPQPGAIVVWPHHVGVLVRPTAAPGVWLVHSGNDGNRIRTRPRRIAGAVFRAL